MKSISSWLLIFFMIIFWIFRIIVVISTQTGNDFGGFISSNYSTEIIILFITILCFILILKRNLLGGLAYLISYLYYFGIDLWQNFIPNVISGQPNIQLTQNALIAIFGILISLLIFIDIIIDNKTKNNHKDKKTDWFFTENKYTRNLDERADKNHYRNY